MIFDDWNNVVTANASWINLVLAINTFHGELKYEGEVVASSKKDE